MEGAEPSGYLAQLKAEFERCCGAGATGQLDRAGLTALSGTLQLDDHLPLLLDTLLGAAPSAKVNFEDFKDGLVAVLSGSLDLSASEDDSSYLQPAVPQEVQPKLVRGAKRYGRRSRPEPPTHTGPTCDPEDAANRTGAADPSPPGVRRAKLRRSTSLESVESLKSDEEAGSAKMDPPLLQNKDQQQEDGGGPGVLAAGCDHLVVQDGDELLRGQEADLQPGVTVREFRKALWSSAPMLSSTPVRPADLQRAPLRNQQLKEEGPARSAPATVGQRLLGRLDDGSGFTSPERVAALWTEEGISNSWEILQTLDFGPEERLGLAELTLALDNELLAGGNGIHQAALVSYRNQIQHLQEQAEQAGRERDKLRADLDRAEQRNLQLVREADERHACMETLSESRVRELEQDFRERLASLRCRAEQDGEALLQQAERERLALQEELQQVRAREARLQEELAGAVQERRRVEEELDGLQEELKEAQSSGRRLQADLDQLLLHKLGSLDPSGAAPSHEERFSELLAEYERQRRELQDRNDELELLRSCRSCRRSPRPAGGAELSWSQQQPDSDDPDMRSSSSPAVRKRLQPADGAALSSLDVSGPSVSIQTELALQQLKQNQEMELQQLQVQLGTQTNYYERQLDLMRRNMEVERKDICQAFKLEISELEEQKAEAEQQVKQLKEAVLRLQNQVQQGGGARSAEEERRMQREQAELEQNYAREMGNLVRRLSAEKEQQEAELKLQMDQEVARVRWVASEPEPARCLLETQARHTEAGRRLLQEEEEQQNLQEAARRRGQSEARLEAQEVLLTRLVPERSCQQEELQQVRRKEAELSACSSSPTPQEVLRSRTGEELDPLNTEGNRLDQRRSREAALQEAQQEASRLDQRRSREAALQEALVEAQQEASCLGQRRSREEALQEALAEAQQEASRLGQENRTYMRLVEQLSSQIVEMEEEISCLREHLRGLSSQLNGTADLVLDLRRQLNARTRQEAPDGPSEREGLLQRALLDSQNRLTRSQQDFEEEKRRLAQQLMELENLVLVLEDATEAAGPPRTQLEEVRSENAALQERLKVLQQQVQNLEDEAEKRRRRLQEVEREHQRSREEEERLHTENCRYREEVLDLSSRNLQLSGANGDLSSRLRGEEASVATLRDRLATVARQREEEAAAVRRLQEELRASQLGSQSRLEAELSGLSRKLQEVEEQKEELQRDAESRRHQVERLQQQNGALQAEAELLRAQLLAATQERLSHAQEGAELRRKLQEALSKVEEQEQLQQNLQQENRRLRDQNQELQQQLSELQVQDVQVQNLRQQLQNLRSRLEEEQRARTQAQDQVLRSDSALGVLKERQEEVRRSQQQEEVRRSQQQEQQSRSVLRIKQEQWEQTAAALQRRVEELEVQLKALRSVLQDRVQQLKQQMERGVQTSGALKELYVENGQLLAALQVTEQRQKRAENKNLQLEEKVGALNELLRQVVATVLAT